MSFVGLHLLWQITEGRAEQFPPWPLESTEQMGVAKGHAGDTLQAFPCPVTHVLQRGPPSYFSLSFNKDISL